jgi:hypothetical protein
MKSLRITLIVVLILSGVIPLPVAFASLFSPANAGAAINLTGMTTDVHNALILNGSYMLSFIVMFWYAAWRMIKNKLGADSLALALGVITLLRGLLLLLTYNIYNYETTVVAYVAIVDGLVVVALSLAGMRNASAGIRNLRGTE